MASARVVIVGAGAAGSAAAHRLAQTGDVEVVVVGAERRMPYNRTTVNKGLLTAAVTADAIILATGHSRVPCPPRSTPPRRIGS